MGIQIAAYPKCFEYDIGLHCTMTVFDWIEMARAGLEVDGLEMYERFLTSFDAGYLRSVRDAVYEAGFAIPMFIASPDFTDPNPAARARAIEHQADMIRVAAALGGPGVVCRVLSGQARAGLPRELGVAWVVEAIEQLIPVAREYGVVLGMENHYKDSQWQYPEFALKMDVFLEIVNGIAEREHFGVQYDPSNALVAGDDAIELLLAVRERVVSMHASDRRLKPGATLDQLRESDGALGYSAHLEHGVIGRGLNDYDRIFGILADAGYGGWVSIEDGVNGLAEMQESARFLRQMQARYFPQ